MSKGAFGKSKFRGVDGKAYDFGKNEVDGAPPLEEGDFFFYRPKGSPGASVHKVKLTRKVGHVGSLILYNADDKPEAFQYVDLRRVEVIAMAAPIEEAPEFFDELILRRHHLLADFRDLPLDEQQLEHFPEEYAKDIHAAKTVRLVDGEKCVVLKCVNTPELVDSVHIWDEVESPGINSGSPPIRHKDFPVEGSASPGV